MALGINGYLLKDDELGDILPCLTYLRFNISAGEAARYSYIHGCKEECFYKVINTIKKAVAIWENKGLDVTIGLQMVLMPEFKDQIIPLTKLGKELKVDYLVIKHCSDDEESTLGVDYEQYDDENLIKVLKEAETYSTDQYQVTVKWSKIMSHGKKRYSKCFGAPLFFKCQERGLWHRAGCFLMKSIKNIILEI